MYIAIVFTLFALMAGMLLLNKTKKEGLGKFFSFISYLVIIVSLLMLICAGTRGIMRMTCCRSMHSSENCMMDKECGPGGCMMMHHEWVRGNARCMEEMRECRMKGDSGSCKMGMKHGCPMEEMEKDTVKK